MNKKLIVAAVSAAVMAPVAAHAESSFYARVNTAIDISNLKDPADPKNGESTTHLSSVSSRFGFKGSTDIGNGLTAHGQYEFAVTSDKEQNNVDDARVATVGLSGGFGRIDVGNQWSAYFNTFGTLISPTYSLGYYLYSSVGGGPYRASNTIKYSNSYGPVSLQLDVRLNDDNTDKDEGVENEKKGVAENQLRGDGIGLGLSYAVTDNITIAAAFDSEDRPSENGNSKVQYADGDVLLKAVAGGFTVDGDSDQTTYDVSSQARDADRIGIAAKGTFGPVWVSVGWQNYELDDTDVTVLSGSTVDLNGDGIADADDDLANVVVDGSTTIDLKGTVDGTDVDTLFIWVGGSISEKTSWLAGYSKADDGVDKGDVLGDIESLDVVSIGETDDSEQLTWGIYHNLGGGLRLYYEATSLDSENTSQDGDRHLLGMRIDF